MSSIVEIRGFHIIDTAANNIFSGMCADPNSIDLIIEISITSGYENEPYIGLFNRILKAHCRVSFFILPFTNIPCWIVIEIVYSQFFWLNLYVPNDCIS